jgi:hypothetical protein
VANGGRGRAAFRKGIKLMRAIRRAAVFIVLGLTLGISGVWASPPQQQASRHVEQVSTPQNLFDSLGGFLTHLWLKAGCSLDPFGRCAPMHTQNTDAGCTLDPNGRCTPAPPQALNTDAGCSMDPWGRCAPNS